MNVPVDVSFGLGSIHLCRPSLKLFRRNTANFPLLPLFNLNAVHSH
jgi:hypothetical protein